MIEKRIDVRKDMVFIIFIRPSALSLSSFRTVARSKKRKYSAGARQNNNIATNRQIKMADVPRGVERRRVFRVLDGICALFHSWRPACPSAVANARKRRANDLKIGFQIDILP